MSKKLEMLDSLGFHKEVENVRQSKCPFCGEFVVEDSFRNEISKKEFTISGLCQPCQDKMFGTD